jgi:hypothetical protein
LTTLDAEAAAGRTITNVTFAIGSNDVTSFIALHPDFFNLPSAQQQQLISEFFGVLTNNYVTVLSQLRSALPDRRAGRPAAQGSVRLHVPAAILPGKVAGVTQAIATADYRKFSTSINSAAA